MARETDCDATEALFNGATAAARPSCLTRFLHANRCPLRLKTLCASRPGLPGAVDAIFEAGQLIGADRAESMEFPGGEADFIAEAEFASSSKLGRGVMQHNRGL